MLKQRTTFTSLVIEPAKLQCSNFSGNLRELVELVKVCKGEPLPKKKKTEYQVQDQLQEELFSEVDLLDEEQQQQEVEQAGEGSYVYYRHLMRHNQCPTCWREVQKGHSCSRKYSCRFCPTAAANEAELRHHKCNRLYLMTVDWLLANCHRDVTGTTADFLIVDNSGVQTWKRVKLSSNKLIQMVLPPLENNRYSREFVNPLYFSPLSS